MLWHPLHRPFAMPCRCRPQTKDKKATAKRAARLKREHTGSLFLYFPAVLTVPGAAAAMEPPAGELINSFARRGKGKEAPCRSEGLLACMGEREGHPPAGGRARAQPPEGRLLARS